MTILQESMSVIHTSIGNDGKDAMVGIRDNPEAKEGVVKDEGCGKADTLLQNCRSKCLSPERNER